MPLTAPEYRRQRIAQWDAVARDLDEPKGMGGYYHTRLRQIYRNAIAPGQRVLELGCGQGDLLNVLKPSHGVGVDFSREMIFRARRRYPHLQFVVGDAHAPPLDEKFDVIVLADLVNDLWDVQAVFENLRPLCTPRTRIVMNFFSRVWELPMNMARRLHLAEPVLEQNWLAAEDVSDLLHLAGLEAIHHWEEILYPIRTPGVDALCNRFLVKLPLFRSLALTNILVARPHPPAMKEKPSVSVIVPARNEAGNIAAIFQRTPTMGEKTEIIFVEGHSSDDTYDAIERAIASNPDRPSKLLRQEGIGKGDAVRAGFAAATGDILMILDADLTVPPEDLPRFYEAIRTRRGEFINGVRLVYPMQRNSMRFLNLLGNKFFGRAFSWVLGQNIRDTLCGTKALRREDYELIAANRAYFGEFDPFGDFDLLFGASRLNLRILDLPIRYQERTYGTTNINRFSHGWLLLRMLVLAAKRLKFT